MGDFGKQLAYRFEGNYILDNGACTLDAPYFERGRELYYDYYRPEDHADLAKFIAANMDGHAWIVSYDNVEPIKNLYAGFRSVVYNVVVYGEREPDRDGDHVLLPQADNPRTGRADSAGWKHHGCGLAMAKQPKLDEPTVNVLKRVLAMPPKPHEAMKVGRAKLKGKRGPKDHASSSKPPSA